MSTVDPASPRPRLLVVDDQPAVREVLAAMLELSGYDVTSAASSAEALALLRGQRFELLLLDVNMPGGSGWSLLDHLACGPGAPPVLMISDERYEGEAKRRGVGFLSKPYRRATVDEAVARMLAASG